MFIGLMRVDKKITKIWLVSIYFGGGLLPQGIGGFIRDLTNKSFKTGPRKKQNFFDENCPKVSQ